ncbi:MAG: HAD-IIIC family phosphatase [Jatrophihabitantaceae bacterium]
MTNSSTLLQAVRSAVDEGRTPPTEVRVSLAQLADPGLARKVGRLLGDLLPQDAGLAPVRLGVLATCTVGPFEPLLRTSLVGVGTLPAISVGDYGNFEMSLASGAFALDGEPDVLACLMDESFFLPADWAGGDVEAVTAHIEARAQEFRALVGSVAQRSSVTLVLHTVPLPAEVRETFLSWRARASLARAWHQLNADLLTLAEEHRQVLVVDLVSLLADQPFPARDARLHRYADLPYTDGALHVLARQVARIVQAKMGLSRKVLALDLDNTLWGGVLGEVGATGVELGGLYPGSCFLNLQRSARRLREQGVILVLASKNDAAIVDDALLNHPEMLLRSDAFSVTAVNWSPKADNLRQAAESLSLSTGSFVFMDDSAFERGQVASVLPEVALVAADGDPAYLVSSLLAPGWFDVLDLTETDRDRPALYRTRALRSDFQGGFGSSEDYLHALSIELCVEPVTEFGVARVAQLAARTNQFNLTGIRFDEARTAAMAADPSHLVASLTVSDRFGDEGVVGALWVDCGEQTWQVLNMVLSCRVLSRGIELAAIDWLAHRANEAGARTLQGSFVASSKNGSAAGFWERAGFRPAPEDGVFTLDLRDGWNPAPNWITQPDRERATR